MHPLLNIAIGAARRAGEVVVRSLDRVGGITVSEKSRNDFVTEVDRQAEQVLIAAVRKAYPAHGFLAEESGEHPGDEYTWVIDPLDGTTNFLHGFPQFAISVACRHRGRAEVAVVLDPLRGELFTAERGAGAQLDGRRLRVSQRLGLEGALIGTGFPYRENRRWLKPYLAMLESVMDATAGVRRPGAASLDLAYVAAGQARRILGGRTRALGHRRGHPAHLRSGRPHRQSRRRRLRGQRPPARGNAARVHGAHRNARALPRRRASQMTAGPGSQS